MLHRLVLQRLLMNCTAAGEALADEKVLAA